VKMHLKQDFQFRTIWDVIGRVKGTASLDEWVVAGNHRDAWVYGAVDPNSGTAAMLETVHGVGELLKSGWKPKRTIIFGSWDGEEEGIIGSTEWAEQREAELAHAAVYFNMDAAVSGSTFGASAVPSLKHFVSDAAKVVPSPKGGTVFDVWKKANQPGTPSAQSLPDAVDYVKRTPVALGKLDVPVGDLGSGSDYTSFLQHLGVPATDITTNGPYGVYHSAFDNFNWFKRFADPDFLYEQQMARMFGIEVLRMADADVLPYDYEEYGKEVMAYIEAARKKADAEFGAEQVVFLDAVQGARRFEQAGAKVLAKQANPGGDSAKLNQSLLAAERGLLIPEGLPKRSWFHHAIYAPGEYTGYAAVVIPGINEAIDRHNAEQVREQIAALAAALNRAAAELEGRH